jgi:hypothetical protein
MKLSGKVIALLEGFAEENFVDSRRLHETRTTFFLPFTEA